MKLFEIPIYALSRDSLMKRYSNRRKKLIDKLNLIRTQNGDQNTINHIIELETWPQRLWDYNHIVGYIVIRVDSTDISFEQYTSVESIKRYHWNSKKAKVFLKKNMINGYHFYFRNYNGGEIRSKIHQMLDDIINRMVDKRFFVDREAFDQADQFIDYSKLLKP